MPGKKTFVNLIHLEFFSEEYPENEYDAHKVDCSVGGLELAAPRKPEVRSRLESRDFLDAKIVGTRHMIMWHVRDPLSIDWTLFDPESTDWEPTESTTEDFFADKTVDIVVPDVSLIELGGQFNPDS
ncbi:hypothetical protein TNCV_1184681 [Trichonephila clavipes]|nr:hypothetical protein TNCV_1184681 [Trichonephila clavipes]